MTATNRALCFTCNKAKAALLCKGCSKEFCFSHLQTHRQDLNGRLDGVINDHDLFRQTFDEQRHTPPNATLIERIDRWEQTSLEAIKRKAQQCRDAVVENSKRTMENIEEKLARSAAQLKELREETEFNEIDLQQLNEELATMTRQLTDPSKVSLRADAQGLIENIDVTIDTETRLELKYHRWNQLGVIVAGGNGQGHRINQLAAPCGIAVDQDQNILIADNFNNRVVRWDSKANRGTIAAGGNGEANQAGQLFQAVDVIVDPQDHSIIVANWGTSEVMRWDGRNAEKPQVLIENIECFGLAMDKQGYFYVVDTKKHEVRRWKEGEEGTIVAGGNGQGKRLNQLNTPRYVFVDGEHSVYVSDMNNHRVMKWRRGANEGVIVAGGNGRGNRFNQLCYPEGIFVDRWGQIYMVDCGNDRVMRWYEGDKEGEIVVGGNGRGEELDQMDRPGGLSFDDQGNLYVSDFGNHRIMKFYLTVV